MFSKIIEFLKSSFSSENLYYVEDAYNKAVGTGLYLILFFIAVIFIIFELRKEKKNKIKLVFGFYSIIVLILNLNPIFAKFAIKIIGNEVYWRVYWLFPIGLVLAYVFTIIIFKMPKRILRILAFCFVLIIIVVSGEFIYTDENFTKVSNYYKVPDTVLEVIFEVSADDEEYKKLTGPEEFIVYTRQIDGTIALSESRSVNGYDEDSLVTYINNGDFENIYNKAFELECNYVVINNNVKNEYDDLSNYGFLKFFENEDYTVYKLEN